MLFLQLELPTGYGRLDSRLSLEGLFDRGPSEGEQSCALKSKGSASADCKTIWRSWDCGSAVMRRSEISWNVCWLWTPLSAHTCSQSARSPQLEPTENVLGDIHLTL